MKALTAHQIQRLDRLAIEREGIPALVLMESAGAAVAREILRDFPGKKLSVCVFCGTGNNGGDGFVIARRLRDAGVRVKVFLAGRRKDLKPDAAVNYAVLTQSRQDVWEITSVDRRVAQAVKSADVLVDALFGVGLNRALGASFCDVISAMNASGKPILAVDIPSGLDATTGKMWGVTVRAYQTVTFTFSKRGFYRRAGPSCVGRVKIAQIGIPRALIRRVARPLQRNLK
jgi:ADP-dependent NAD(P)H-hydrate dehydratase / NAD(P)H-hydrate epimerase